MENLNLAITHPTTDIIYDVNVGADTTADELAHHLIENNILPDDVYMFGAPNGNKLEGTMTLRQAGVREGDTLNTVATGIGGAA